MLSFKTSQSNLLERVFSCWSWPSAKTACDNRIQEISLGKSPISILLQSNSYRLRVNYVFFFYYPVMIL